jgi:hypothetical protein
MLLLLQIVIFSLNQLIDVKFAKRKNFIIFQLVKSKLVIYK